MKSPKPLETSMEQLSAIVDRASKGPLNEEEAGILRAVLETLQFMTNALEKKSISIARLRSWSSKTCDWLT